MSSPLPPLLALCRVLEGGSSAELPEALEEANVLVELLSQRHRALVSTLEGAFPELRSTVWQSDTTVQVRRPVVCVYHRPLWPQLLLGV